MTEIKLDPGYFRASMTEIKLYPNYFQACLQLIYWVFFRPITFNDYIRQLLRDRYSLWEARKHWHSVLTRFTLVSLGTMIIAPFIISLPINLFIKFYVLGFDNLTNTFLTAIIPVAKGVTFGVAFGVAVGVATGVAGDVALGVAFGVAGGVAVGVAGGVAFGVAFGVAVGVAFGVVDGVAGIIGYFHFYLYIFQFPFQAFLFLFIKIKPNLSTKITKKSPVFWDEMIWFPLPFLDQMLRLSFLQDQSTGLDYIQTVAASFRQKKNCHVCYFMDYT